jgi:hypothetical protein
MAVLSGLRTINHSILKKYRGFEYKYRAVVTFPGKDGRPKIVELSNDAPTQSLGNVTLRSALNPLDGTF